MSNQLVLFFILIFTIVPSMAQSWDDCIEWKIINNSSHLNLSNFMDGETKGVKAEFDLRDAPNNSWVIMQLEPNQAFNPDVPIVFNLSAIASCDLEIKMIDDNGTVYLRRIPMANDKYKNWTPFVVYLDDLDFGWSNNNSGEFKKFKQFEKFKLFEIAFSSKRNETGTVWITGAGFGTKGINSSLFDSNADLRRDEEPSPENPMVLEWLKVVQDNASRDGILLPSEGINHSKASTYDNSLVAMVFMLRGERERAERILNFYANATIICNKDPELQNFFYKGEARGFFQQVAIENNTISSREVKAYHVDGPSDRWLGDMCWLMLAYKYYEKKYDSQKYDQVECLLTGLLLSWYNSTGGYIESGWRKNETQVDNHLHEKNKDGHPEGNIDAYAVMMLYNESEIASNISKWLDKKLGFGSGYPLDLYTWRNLSGETDGRVLSCLDTDLRYLIALDYQGKKVMGVWDGIIENENTIWVDGVGQLACAFYEAGDPEKGNYYANQMDRYFKNETIGYKQYLVLPSNIAKDSHNTAAISSAAWYIFAKNQFNPMKLKSNRNSIP